jgi:hypothetical protein
MNKLIQTLTNTGLTDNGAVTNKSSFSPLVDFIFLAGASRKISEADITALVARAYEFDKDKTIKLIFWAGSIRGGLGERRFFKIALKYLATALNHTDLSVELSDVITNNIANITHFSRWDVLFDLYEDGTNTFSTRIAILDYIQKAFTEGTDALLFKWLPREGCKKYPKLRKKLTELAGGAKAYRQTLSAKSRVVETEMSANKWDAIKYEHVPSKAMNNYSKAFRKHSPERFAEYLGDVTKGVKKINSSVLFPSDLVEAVWDRDAATADVQWKALPDYLKGKASSTLVVCDVSGSMEGEPMNVSVGLGIYLSERLTGDFKNLVCTFSSNPAFFTIPEGTLKEKVIALKNANWHMSTNFGKVFELVLSRAKANNITEEDMPKNILVISDMEFNSADDNRTNFEYVQDLYKASGYTIPKLVFWNVNGRIGNTPATINDKGVQLISGFSPSTMKYVLEAEANPEALVESIVNDEAYAIIKT